MVNVRSIFGVCGDVGVLRRGVGDLEVRFIISDFEDKLRGYLEVFLTMRD